MKKLLQILAPFATLIAVILIFYGIGCVFAILGIISDFFTWKIENVFGEIMSFFFIFSGEYPLGSSVVSVIVWITLTIFAEILIESNDDWENFFAPHKQSQTITNEKKVEQETTTTTSIAHGTLDITNPSFEEEIPIAEENNQWTEAIANYKTKRVELITERNILSEFATARQKLFVTLQKESDYESLMQQSAETLHHNRATQAERKRKRTVQYVLYSILYAIIFTVCLLGLIFCCIITSGEWMVVFFILSFIYMFIGIYVLKWMCIRVMTRLVWKYRDREYENKYTKEFIEPFIKKNIETYKFVYEIGAVVYTDWIITSPTSAGVGPVIKETYTIILEQEICNFDAINNDITEMIAEYDAQISEIDHQIKLLQSLS